MAVCSEAYMEVQQQVSGLQAERDELRQQLQQAEARVAELEPIVEELANDLESEVEARRPGELDRRIDRDLVIVKEARDALSRSNGEAFILRKQAEAVDASKSLFSRWNGSIITVEHGRVILEQEARRLHHRADELEAEDAGDSND
ncbi:MAG: hypothetical protein AWU57_424 [Marinobacter sp. T13-3]|nr:MAG: hypothetical protein AWU57_424 [Marinobacter sp. T13-3]